MRRREQIVTLAEHAAIPTIYEWREAAAAGGLISYGPSLTGIIARSAFTWKLLAPVIGFALACVIAATYYSSLMPRTYFCARLLETLG